MQYRTIPGTDLSVSQIALGTWVFGEEGWGKCSQKEAKDALHRAIREGINLIDTAPIYGFGLAESVIGEALKEHKREDIILATKCGLKGEGMKITVDLSAYFIEEDLHASLRRLQTDYIDLYQCHWPDTKTPIEETMKALAKFKKQGLIRYIGVSNFSLDELKEAMQIAHVHTVQMHYSYLERSVEEDILPFCAENGIGFLAYGPLGGGILTGKYHAPCAFPGNDTRSYFYKFYKKNVFKKSEQALVELKHIAEKHQKPVGQTAINWVLSHPAVSSALVGCRNTAQAADNAASAVWNLPPCATIIQGR